MKILLISLAGIGDTLLATPLIRALREHWPAATLDCLVRWSGARDLLALNPHLNEVFQCNLLHKKFLADTAFLWSLRRKQYDLSINVYPQGRREYRFVARFLNARQRLSHRYENHCRLDDHLITASIDQDYSIHCIDNNLRLLRLLNAPIPDGLDAEIFFTPEDTAWAANYAVANRFQTRTVIGFQVGSGKTKNLILKRWPRDHYIQLGRKLLAEYPEGLILLFGGPEEREDNEAIAATLATDRVRLVPSKTLKQAAALLRHCDLFLSVDNAFMHLAATVKVPRQVVIESPTFNKTIDPYRRPFTLVRNPMVGGRNLDYYRYDGRNIQGSTEHLLACMRSVTPDHVMEAVRESLARPGLPSASK